MSEETSESHKRRFTYVGGSSSKFWEINKPIALPNNAGGSYWSVRVRFGRIGTVGQGHNKIFNYKYAAVLYHDAKIHEKLNKGYKETLLSTVYTINSALVASKAKLNFAHKEQEAYFNEPKPFLKAKAETIQQMTKPVKPACLHTHIKKVKPNVYKCGCGETIEFDRAPGTKEIEITPVAVKRFIDIGALRGDS